MKRTLLILNLFALVLGTLATQSCEFTDGQNSYYNRGDYGYYRDGGYTGDNGYYHQRRYAPDDYQSDRPAIYVHF